VCAEAFEVWGWRVPFLLSIFSLAAAVALRYNMPNSIEFDVARRNMTAGYNARVCHQQEGPDQEQHASLHQQQKAQRSQQEPEAKEDECLNMSSSSLVSSSTTPQVYILGAPSAVGGVAKREAPAGAVASCATCPAKAISADALGDMEAAALPGHMAAAGARKHYVPLLELMRVHGLAVCLIIGYGAW
jgi:hypothetical protein